MASTTAGSKTPARSANRQARPGNAKSAPASSANRPRNAANRSSAQQTVRKTGNNGVKPNSAPRKRKRKKKSKAPVIALVSVICFVLAVVLVYFFGYMYYKDKFTANTYINGIDVSGKTFDEASKLFDHEEVPDTLQITRPSGDIVNISLEAIDYNYSYEKELKRIYDDLDRKSWFSFIFSQTEYGFTDVASYNKQKLMEQIDLSDWGTEENQNAKLKSDDNGWYVQPEVQGDVFDMDILKDYISKCLDKASYTVIGTDSGAYTPPKTVTSDYDAKLETLNKLWNVKLYTNFDYTKDLLTGKKLCKMVNVKRDGSYTVDEDAVMKYVEHLARKYDTYNTERKFKATIQGKITVPTSSDAKYGWWLDQQQTCDLLVECIENGKTKKNIKPIYYKQGNFEFSGLASARSEKDDIGKTYLEVDLTNQQFWYYKKGKQVRHGYIVSGQTTSAARTTLPGVYKVWQKATNYRMKDSNADGEEWDTTCNYWTRIAIVGIGMHDSTWRGAFGGEIYKYNGSHGCINMTYADAQYIYENVAMDTPVVMYY